MMPPSLSGICSAYANSASLVCVGTARTTVTKSGCSASARYSMRLAFLRGRFLVLAYDKEMRQKPIDRGVVFRVGNGTARCTTSAGCSAQVIPIKAALASIAGVTAGMSVLVPALLIEAKELAPLDLLSPDPRPRRQDRRHYFFSGVVKPGCHRTVVINSQSFLIESVVDEYSSGDGKYCTKTTYRYV